MVHFSGCVQQAGQRVSCSAQTLQTAASQQLQRTPEPCANGCPHDSQVSVPRSIHHGIFFGLAGMSRHHQRAAFVPFH
jgi:hypothetical protein